LIPGDFQFKKPTRKDFLRLSVLGLVSLGALAGIALGLTFVISAWLGRPVVFGFNEGPDQPVAYPHPPHVQNLGLDCTFCHRTVATEPAASIPPVGLCMTCHQVMGDGRPEVEKLRAIAASGQPINWRRVHRMPDHVQFVHDAHVRFFSQDGRTTAEVCAICHGDVGSMTKVRQVRSLKMGDCVDCHRQNNAPTDCFTCHY
jgi:hypothetical protein